VVRLELDVISLLLLAVGLSMDVLSVSAVTGFGLGKLSSNQMLRLAAAFGGFHVFMPILGWLAGSTIVDLISIYDHWAAFLLLALVGGKMFIEGVRGGEKVEVDSILVFKNLLLFSVAVSIDSVAVGLSFSLEKVAILVPALVIGATAFVVTYIGVYLGNKTGHWLGKWSPIIGGVILFGIGLRVLLTHLLI
jgi:manganese efflux pump family protein